MAALGTGCAREDPAGGGDTVSSSGPDAADRCPVCGMFVSRHEAWRAAIDFDDGHRVCFDGVKDLFKYYFDVARYEPGRTTNRIRAVEVSEYYSLRRMDGRGVWYVVGSDVLGPMGAELIPCATEAAAREFARDHGGTLVVTFAEVTRDLVAALDGGGALPSVAGRGRGKAGP